MMRALWYISLLLLLLARPGFAYSESQFVVAVGTIGDFSAGSRTYEIGGKLYTFDAAIVIESTYGEALDFKALQGGVRVNIIGEKSYSNGKETITYKKIIVYMTNKK